MFGACWSAADKYNSGTVLASLADASRLPGSAVVAATFIPAATAAVAVARRPMRLGGGLGGDSRLPKEPRKKQLADAAAKGLPPPADERSLIRYSGQAARGRWSQSRWYAARPTALHHTILRGMAGRAAVAACCQPLLSGSGMSVAAIWLDRMCACMHVACTTRACSTTQQRT